MAYSESETSKRHKNITSLTIKTDKRNCEQTLFDTETYFTLFPRIHIIKL